MGPKALTSTVPTPAEEGIVVEFRHRTPPPLDDVPAFVTACNFAKPLESLRWTIPFQTICQAWIEDPDRFEIDPHHLTRDHTPSPAAPGAVRHCR